MALSITTRVAMIKSFLLLNLVLIVMVVSITLHYFFYPKKESTQALQTITELTSQSKLSLSVAYYESSYNPTYPEMPNLKKMDFIYE